MPPPETKIKQVAGLGISMQSIALSHLARLPQENLNRNKLLDPILAVQFRDNLATRICEGKPI
jgi:hypothetical protein